MTDLPTNASNDSGSRARRSIDPDARYAMNPLLDELEQSIGAGHFDRSVSLLHTLLSNFDRMQARDDGDIDSLSPRLADAVTELLLHPRFELSQQAYEVLCMSQPALAGVFLCSPRGSADDVIARLADMSDPAGPRFRNLDILRKCLLCHTPNSGYRLALRDFAERHPEIIAPVVIGRLGCDLLSRPRIAGAIDDMVATDWSFLRHYTPPLPLVLGLSNAWMQCSYATHPARHRVKADLNGMARQWLHARGIPADTAGSRRDIARPRLLVPLEAFHTTHAMFRCFDRIVARLGERFELIGMAPHHCIDDEARSLFPRFIGFDARRMIDDFAGLVAEIRQLRPDIVYYPSLGMANYTILLANLRLAPLQCFSMGHPATSHCDTIDYALVQEKDFATADVFSETVVLTADEASPTIDRALEWIPEPVLREHPRTVEIAVNSKCMKLHHRFLHCCRIIAESVDRPVRFHFFPGVSGHRYAIVAHEIRRILPASEVYPTTDYATYIARMSACDVRLGTFPFGGDNTNMDCFGLAIPFAVMDGDEPHTHSDATQVRCAGLPDWLVVQSEPEYIAAARRLIDNDTVRLDIARAMLQLRDNGFFHGGLNHETPAFSDTLAWLYRNHPSIRGHGRRVWTRAEQREDILPCTS